jgi:hypothetical protein
MASALSFTVNDNKTLKNLEAINTFIEPRIFMNKLIKNRRLIINNSKIIELDPRYDIRPDKMAYEYNADDFWYPAILNAKNLGSILQFKAGNMSFKCNIPNKKIISTILGKETKEIANINTIVNNIFKT